MIHLVTFATDDMSHAAKLCVESAKAHGVDKAVRFGTDHPSPERGCGFWKWKPQIIDLYLRGGAYELWRDVRALVAPADGDILIYADAGVELINNVSHIIDRMDQDIFLFGNQWEHAHWCKRDIVEAIWPMFPLHPDTKMTDLLSNSITWCRFGKQCQASVIFVRVSDYSRKFVKEWLDWCLFEGGRLIDDSPSRSPNHPEFQENRHDQAILTTMAYREGIKLHWWPARYNMDQPGGGFIYPKDGYESDDYEPIFFHHRRRNHEWSVAA